MVRNPFPRPEIGGGMQAYMETLACSPMLQPHNRQKKTPAEAGAEVIEAGFVQARNLSSSKASNILAELHCQVEIPMELVKISESQQRCCANAT